MNDKVRYFRMTLIGAKFETFWPYHPSHFGSEVRWSYRSSVVDHADVVVLTFSLYENASLIIFSAETEYISTRSWYRNINFLKRHLPVFGRWFFWVNIYIRSNNSHICGRKNIFDIYVTEYGTALTTILPILFLYLNTVTVTAGTQDIGIGI
jgi:hypothetical protein